MSWFENDELPCPACGEKFVGATAETINVTRMPEARERILEDTFNRVECPSCHTALHVDRAFLYTDMKAQQFVQVFPRSRIGEWPHWEEVTLQVFEGAFGNAPEGMKAFATGFRVRTVFGAGALADKLRIWDAGLDDGIVELLKLELRASQPELRALTDLWLDVALVDAPAGLIEVNAFSAGRVPMRFGMRLARYEELAARRDELMEKYMGLFARPFVGYRRLAREPLAKELWPKAPSDEEAT